MTRSHVSIQTGSTRLGYLQRTHIPRKPRAVGGAISSPDGRRRLQDRFFPDEYGTGFSMEARADGLHASIGPVEVWVWDDADLPGFLAGLAEEFRGWTGERWGMT